MVKKEWLLLALAIAMQACIGVRVKTSEAPNNKLSESKTFCWIQGCEFQFEGPTQNFDTVAMLNLKNAIQKELEAKGYVNDPGSHDLLVGFHVTLEEQEVLIDRSETFNGYGPPVSYWDEYEPKVFKFMKGALVIDVVDSDKSQVIWQSIVSKYMSGAPQTDSLRIGKVVKKALRDFPIVAAD